jgi:translocator protein
MGSLVRFGVSMLASYGAGFLATLFVQDGVRGWFAALEKPFFTPPDWLFGLVWFVLYGLMGLALYIVWENDPHAREMRGWVPLFFAHLLLNAAWAIFFFGFHALLIALIDIVLLLWCVIMLFVGAYEIDKRAAWLLVPYGLWVFFLTILNASIWLMN